MKKLIVSLKSSSEVIKDFGKAFKAVRKKSLKAPHYEISFDNRKSFDRFARNIYILSNILTFKPKSVYELSKILGMDVSNLNKIIIFFEELGAIQIKKKIIDGREVKTPVVNYGEIVIDLKAA
jgi:predicted transcriptional regulator